MRLRGLLVALALCTLAAPAAHASYPGANGKILFSRCDSSNCDLWTMNADGTGQAPITSTSSTVEFAGSWSPDGSKVVFVGRTGSANARVYTMNANGTGQIDVTPDLSGPPFNGTANPTDAKWSPDGSKIALTHGSFCGASGAHLLIMNPDGSNPQRVVCGWPGADPPQQEAGGAAGVAWRPDGLKLAVDGPNNSSLDARIWTVNTDGTGLTQVDPHWEPFNPENDPDWSPDGTRIAYYESFVGGLVTIRPDGTGRTEPRSGYYPIWSPDNTRIAFTEPNTSDIWTTKPDGTTSVQLTSDSSFERPLSWLAIPQNAYPRPRGATPTRVSLVTAYNQCTSADRTHGPPLAFPSCSSPTQSSSQLTVGTGDSNGKPALNEGYLVLRTIAGAPGGVDDSDVALEFLLDDVFTNALADYTGNLRAHLSLQITDKLNTPNPGGPGAATTVEVPLDLSASCTPVADPNEGSACAANTTVDALIPGAVPEGRRAIWQLGPVQVYDASDALFATQGIFIP